MPPERPFLGDGVRKLGHAKFSHAPAFDTLDSADHPPSIALWTGHFRVTLRTVQSFNAGDRPMKSTKLKLVRSTDMRPVAPAGRKTNDAYRVREHLTEAEMTSS